MHSDLINKIKAFKKHTNISLSKRDNRFYAGGNCISSSGHRVEIRAGGSSIEEALNNLLSKMKLML